MRVCKNCGEEKPLSQFGQTTSEGNGRKYRRHECYSCKNKRHFAWREKNREHLRKYSREQMRNRRTAMKKADLKAYLKAGAMAAKQRRDLLKAQIYAAYGGTRCGCCGETEPMFLSIDHVNNDGYSMRKNKIHGSGALLMEYIWRSYRKTGQWPRGFQILCMNCQHGKSRNNGICPHQAGKV